MKGKNFHMLILMAWVQNSVLIGKGLASLAAQRVKNPPARQETWVQSLSWEDPLEEEMATHSSMLARRIHTDREA